MVFFSMSCGWAGVLAEVGDPIAAPALLATGFANITSIASDGTYIYFGTINGQLFRMTKSGGDLRNIANVPGFVGQVLFHNGNIWFYANPTTFGGASIYVMPRDLSAVPTTSSLKFVSYFLCCL